jgi:uridine kinase
MRHVVAVAGVAGAGKSSLVEALLGRLEDASAIHVDSYQRVTERPVAQLVQWMARGADFDEFAIPLIGEHLGRLKAGEAVVEPATRREIRPGRYILFETHFGRLHRDSGRHVDLLVWIDTPLDVALARNIADLVAPLLRGHKADPSWESVAALQRYLSSYLADVRRLRLLQRERMLADADVVLDGANPFDALVEEARREIRARLP